MSWLIAGIVAVQAIAWVSVCSFLMFKGVSNLVANSASSAGPDPRTHKTGIILLTAASVVFVVPPLLILAVKKFSRPKKTEFRPVPSEDLEFRPTTEEDPPPTYEEATKFSSKTHLSVRSVGVHCEIKRETQA